MGDFRAVPSIEQLRQRPAVRVLEARFGASATLQALRAGAATVRSRMATDAALDRTSVAADIESLAAAHLAEEFRPSLEPVINATGVILHTNLGRAPLAAAAVARVADVAGGYSNLEYDVAAGARGRRDVHAEALLRRLTGAEAAVVVNNNAAATLLMLATLAAGREVIVSRGELVEIGGGFRVPDVMAQSGAVLREVGTTNRTRAADYAAAISDRTALILRVHPSNFRIEGFTERPAIGELVTLGRRFNLPVAEDLGSGLLTADSGHPLAGIEPSVRETLEAGADLCCFSGDKLLGGPQAGIITGRAGLVDRVRRHPLMRALRVDKMIYAALEATLTEFVADRAATTVPVQQMMAMSADTIRSRAARMASSLSQLDSWKTELVEGHSAIGGGSAPGVQLSTWLLALERNGVTANGLDEQLRRQTPPVIARIERDRVLFDLRTVLPEQDATLIRLVHEL